MNRLPKLGPPPDRLGSCYSEIVAAFDGVDADHRLSVVRHLGITGQAILNAGAALTTGNVRALAGNYFEPTDDGGVEVVLVPVVQEVMVIDVAAFQPSQPERWRLRTGLGVFLGESAIETAKFRDEPLVLHPTPLAWLHAECQGACVIDWTASLLFHLGAVPRVVCVEANTARRLNEAIQREARPRIDIRVKETVRAAA
jgi:hypothetical protein